MKKSEIREIVKRAAENKQSINADFRYDSNYFNFVPLKVDQNLFLALHDLDFELDGYIIYRWNDLVTVKEKGDFYNTILRQERCIDHIDIPSINTSCWKTVFESLKEMNQNVIVEKRWGSSDGWEFIIGKIDRIYQKFVYVWHFDADGVWMDEPVKIPYSEITHVTFGSRYIRMYSKYLDTQEHIR